MSEANGGAVREEELGEVRASVDKLELYLVCQRLKVVVKSEFARFGLDPKTLNENAAINATAIRNAMIRDEFNRGRRLGIKAERMYCDLSLKHGVSFDHIVNIVKSKV